MPNEWQIVSGDCFKILATLQDDAVDHVITDPPYDAETHENATSSKGKGTKIKIDFDPLSDPFILVPELLRVSKRWVVSFCSVEQLGTYRRAGKASYLRGGAWDRPDGTPQISGDRPAQGFEGIAILHNPGRKKWNAGGKRGVWRCGVERGTRYHPTQKPIKLMVDLIRDFTDPGDLVLDPFCGSGTTGVAALQLGRRFIGIELDPKYAKIARERLSEVTVDPVVFGKKIRQKRLL